MAEPMVARAAGGADPVSVCIEAAQLWIPERSADVDDVMLNAVGALLGYWLLLLIRPRPSAGEPLLGPD